MGDFRTSDLHTHHPKPQVDVSYQSPVVSCIHAVFLCEVL